MTNSKEQDVGFYLWVVPMVVMAVYMFFDGENPVLLSVLGLVSMIGLFITIAEA